MTSRAPHDLGLHRVLSPRGALPQGAERLDAASARFANEIEIAVETLNIDSASFHQIVGEVGAEERAIAARIESIVAERGKMQTPVTGSGGMLLGRVTSLGPAYRAPAPGIEPGAAVATLVSLTLTPLRLDEVRRVHMKADQLEVRGRAFLWPSSPVVAIPNDLDARVALSALDVCGAPAQARRLAEGAERVLVLGAGKSGTLSAAAVRDRLGPEVFIAASDRDQEALDALTDAGLADAARPADARSATEVLDAALSMSGGARYDLVLNTYNIGGTEMAAILPCADRGKVYFFNMATDFARAALGCEGVGRDVDLFIGNGYAHGHAELTLDLVRRYPPIAARLAAIVGA